MLCAWLRKSKKSSRTISFFPNRKSSSACARHRHLICEPLEERRLLTVASPQVELYNSSPALFVANQSQLAHESVGLVQQGNAANVAWMTYLGGSNTDSAYGAAQDAQGNIIVAGLTCSTDFPGAKNSFNGGSYDGFVAKYSADHTLQWATYIGGSSDDSIYELSLDAEGNALVAGLTYSTDFAGANNAYNGGGSDGFVAKISTNGTLQWATYVGGSSDDSAYVLSVDSTGNAFAAGESSSTDFSGAINSYNGSKDAFVAKISTNGALQWASYLGGSSSDCADGLSLDANGNVFVGGGTYSTDFPSAINASAGNGDAFAAKISNSGVLQWATYLGGSEYDYTYEIAVDSNGNALATGTTNSANFAGAINSYAGYGDAFVTKISTNGTVQWATYLGGIGSDYTYGICLDAKGNTFVSGATNSTDFSEATNISKGNGDAFAAKISADGTTQWATYLGGSDYDRSQGICLDAEGNLLVSGVTDSIDFTGAAFTLKGRNAFLAKITGTADLPATFATVIGTTPSLTSGTLAVGTTEINVNFSKNVFSNTSTDFELRGIGHDGLLGTIDDVIIVPSNFYFLDRKTAILDFPPLEESIYRLTVHGSIKDARGNMLDGNNDGTPGGDWTADFVATATALFPVLANSPAGGSSPHGASKVITADMNHDGKSDVVVINSNDSMSKVRVLLGIGNGQFGEPTIIDTGLINACDVVSADFNGDGNIDLAVSDGWYFIGILLGDGKGGFATPIMCQGINDEYPFYCLATGDFNGDGKVDLVATNGGSYGYYGGISILLGDGTGNFGTPSMHSSGGSYPIGIVVGDFSGEGKDELAVLNCRGIDGSINVFSNGTTKLDFSGYMGAVDLEAGDFNGDGKTDLALLGDSGTVRIYLSEGSGVFSSPTTYGDGGYRSDHLASGDFNGDGNMDLAMTIGGNGSIGILLGDGNGGFAQTDEYITGAGSICLAAGDFNGDGKPDLVQTAAFNNYPDYVNTIGILLNCYNPPVATGSFGAGEFVQGGNSSTSNIFNGYGRLVVGGTLFQPNTLSSGTSNSGQSLVTGNGTFSGLTVSREITVPNTGSQDFARTIDTFTNTTGAPITTTVQILGNLGSDAATTVFATSDGDKIVEPSDRWIGTDGNGTPAVIHYIHGPEGLQPSSVGLIGDNIQWTYNLTVPAGQTVQLAYFTIVGTSRTEAIAAAHALVGDGGFGGQAGAFLSTVDMAALSNFQFPMVVDVTPTQNSHNAQPTTDISIVFREDIDPASVSDQTFIVQDMQTGQLISLQGVITVNGKTITLHPSRPFHAGELIQVTATTGIQTTTGQGLDAPYVWQFQIAPTSGYAQFADNGQNLMEDTFSGGVVASGDLDGNGSLDVIFHAGYASAYQIWLNDGAGRFINSGQDLGNTGHGVQLGDLNGDGHLDIQLGSKVFFNDGAGHFADSGQSLDMGNFVSLGDIDGDGDLDAIGLSLWINDGTGHFTDSGQAIGPTGSNKTLGDLDNDGDLDALVTVAQSLQSDMRLQVWLNDGSGHFTDSGLRVGNPANESVSVVLGDLNNDGYLDAIVGNHNFDMGVGGETPSEIWLNNGNGSFYDSGRSFHSYCLTLGDVDADGDLDAVVLYSASIPVPFPAEVLLNDGQGNFTYAATVGPAGSEGVLLGDFDGNGSIDAFFNYRNPGVKNGSTVWLNAPLTVKINQTENQSDPAHDWPIHFTVDFSRPVTDFSAQDVTLSGTAGATMATVTLIGVDGTTYDVAVSGMTGSGTVIASIAQGAAHDSTGNPNEISTSNDNSVNFNVVGTPSFKLTGPASGTYAPGHLVTITWTANNVSGNKVISLCLDQDTKLWNGNERWIEVDKITASNGNGSYTFDPGNFPTGRYYVGGYMYDKKLWTFTESHTKNPITIPSPSFTLTGPTSGTFIAGQSFNITWTAANVSSNSVISLCLDRDTKLWNGNERWIEVDKVAAANGNGFYSFDPSGIVPGKYYVGGYMYDKVTHIFTNDHLLQSITISNNATNALAGVFNSNVSSSKKKEAAATDSVLQLQDTWL
jgi:Bacterial Ig-like domain/FG-GAP-like repeat/Beta-propeller repeat